MRRTWPVALAVAAFTALGALAAPAVADAQLSRLTRCADQPGFRCGTLAVPLDRSGATPGTLRLRVAVQEGYVRGRRLTVALSGGPGQPGLPFAAMFADALGPLVDAGERLAVLDQRGTGRRALRCAGLQRLRALDSFHPQEVAACAAALGPARRHVATPDSVDDLEDLRVALGAPRLGLFGVSYGTHVALQYARTHPARTRQLVLDSVLGPRGWDGLLLDTFGAVPRVLRERCAGTRCAATTADPVADLAAAAARAEGEGLRARLPDARGRLRTVRRRLGEGLLFALLAGDVNPELGALLPAALASAARGDDAPLLRLLPAANGPRVHAHELSAGVLVATDCADARLPYRLTTPLAERPARLDAALAAVPPERYAPFSAATLRAASLGDDCLLWPAEPVRPPAEGPLPDVPALLLAGRLDIRTPLENALATAAELPRAAVVDVPGAGHDVLGFDVTACGRRALARFAAGRPVGTPCAGRPALAEPAPRAPLALAELAPAPGTAGVRGRVVAAALATADDVVRGAYALQDGGVEARGGCLRAGRFAAGARGLRLHRCAYVRGVRLDGVLGADGSGLVRVRGPRGASGTLRLTRRGAVGRLGGRAVRVTRSSRTAAARPAPGRRAARARRAGDRRAAPWPRPRTPAR